MIYAGETLREEPERAWNGDKFRVEVPDSNGVLLFIIKTECIEAPHQRCQRQSRTNLLNYVARSRALMASASS